jgi:hypothetical protein
MASIIGVQELQHTNGTSAATIDSSGRILTPARPSFLCRPTTTLSQTTSGWRTVDFATVDHDIGSNLHADGYFVAPVDGVYHFNFGARLDDIGSGFAIVALAPNNTGTSPSSSALYNSSYHIIGTPSSNYHSLNASTTIQLSANDKVVTWVYSADTSWDVHAQSSFSGFLVG